MFPAMVRLLSGDTTEGSTFIASRCKYMINNECNKGEEVDTTDLRIS